MENELQKTENSPLAMAVELCKADSGIDVEKLAKLFELQERHEAREAKKAYVVAMAEFKTDPPEIVKNKKVGFGSTNYKHATLHNVTTSINQALCSHGLTASWLTDSNGAVKVTCKITHALGHSEETCLSAPPDDSGKKNKIQAIGSTVTYLQRYTLLALTGLSTYDQDDDGNGAGSGGEIPEPSKKQVEVLKAICDKMVDSVPEGRTLVDTRVDAVFYAQQGKYPEDMARVGAAAAWIISLLDKDKSWNTVTKEAIS